MRKARGDEPSKSLSSRVRSQTRSKPQVTSKEESSETKRRASDQKQASDGRSKTVKPASTKSSKQNGSGEVDHQTPIIKSRTNTRSSNSSVAVSSRDAIKSSRNVKNPADGSKSRTEKKVDSEKRGISTIYMPKTGITKKSTKSVETGKDSRIQRSSTRSKDASETKVTKVSTKDATVAAKSQNASRQRLSSRERRRSRTLSPSEVKVLHSRYTSGSSKKVTTTDVHTSKQKIVNDVSAKVEDEHEYEDDFEDYESDFEECTESEVSEVSESSSQSNEITADKPIELQVEKQKKTINSVESKKLDEDRMLDSGHYELAEARRRAAKIEAISLPRESKPPDPGIIVQPSISSYREERSNENKSLPSSTDEGFEDSRSGDFAKSPPLSRIAYIEFRKASKDNETTKPSSPKILSRGEKLLEMIKLDTVEWSIFESKPIAYEEFIRTHGKLNTRQMCVQTNEDNLEVETQTDLIEVTNTWTQCPVKCRTILRTEEDIKLFSAECMGTGSENNVESRATSRPSYDVLQLNEFLAQAGKVMLALLEKPESGSNPSVDNIHELPFSESAVKLSIDNVTFLAGRPVTIIQYSEVSNRVLLTIHAPVDEDIETSRDEDFVTDCSIGCVWNIHQPSGPMKIFYSPCMITSCCFHSTSYNIVLAGLEDGSISIWDLTEDETWHRKIVDKENNLKWTVRSSTYSSIGNFEVSGHDSEIVALRVLSKIEDCHENSGSDNFMPIQICSLDANGKLIIWSVLRNMNRAGSDDLGISWWGNLKLIKSQEIILSNKKSKRNKNLKGFTDMRVNTLDTNSLYIATNSSEILHATRIGKFANPPIYKSNQMDWCGDTKCIENCPFDQPFFLVGCGDGTIRLHSATSEKPLLQLKHESCNASIKALHWSRSKPLTIFVLDVDSTIHVWDLSNSDIYPKHSISTKNWTHFDSIDLSPCRTAQEMTNQYMALGSNNGCVEVHRLNKNYHYSHKDATNREMNTFLRYVEIL